jgi:uncharacterized membrane protein YGL010W
VHVIFAPAIFTTAMSVIARIPITGNFNLFHIGAAFYAASLLKMEPVAGTLNAPVIGAMEYLGSQMFIPYVPANTAAHLLGRVSQALTHKCAQGRQPAFTEDPFQTIHTAVFFVCMELLFYPRYRTREGGVGKAGEGANFEDERRGGRQDGEGRCIKCGYQNC